MREFFVWFAVELKRNFNNPRYILFGIIVIPLILGIFIALIFSNEHRFIKNNFYYNLLSFIAIASAFLGTLRGILDIYRDINLLSKFQRSGLNIKLCFLSKVLNAAIVGILQVALLNLPTFFLLNIPIEIYIVIYYNICLSFMVFLSCYALGLIFSSLIKNDILACICVAVLLLPQIIMGGVTPYKKMPDIIFVGSKLLYQDEDNEAMKDRLPPIAYILPIPVGFEAMVNANAVIAKQIGNQTNIDFLNTRIANAVIGGAKNKFMSENKEVFGVKIYTYKLNFLIMLIYSVCFGFLAYGVFITNNKTKFIKKG